MEGSAQGHRPIESRHDLTRELRRAALLHRRALLAKVRRLN